VDIYKIAEVAHCAPLMRNSSPSATPLARINLRLKVEAAFMPEGKPVTFFTGRRPAGPSWKHREGIPRRFTADVSPTQRPESNRQSTVFPLVEIKLHTLSIELSRANHYTELFVHGHVRDDGSRKGICVIP
jgi:hypothetical protein